MQSTLNSTTIESVANTVMQMSEMSVLRYVVYLLYLGGDSILATKTAILAFYGQFMLVLLRIAYKEPRPYWVNPQIQGKLCEQDFEGPSDHLFIITFLGTYLNLIYLRMYAKEPHVIKSLLCFLLQALLIAATIFSGMLLGHTYFT